MLPWYRMPTLRVRRCLYYFRTFRAIPLPQTQVTSVCKQM
jgi:hypothetical protein